MVVYLLINIQFLKKYLIHTYILLLECNNIDKYPLMIESDKLYKKLFDKWLQNKKCKEIRNILSELRNWRKKIS